MISMKCGSGSLSGIEKLYGPDCRKLVLSGCLHGCIFVENILEVNNLSSSLIKLALRLYIHLPGYANYARIYTACTLVLVELGKAIQDLETKYSTYWRY